MDDLLAIELIFTYSLLYNFLYYFLLSTRKRSFIDFKDLHTPKIQILN